MPSLSLSVRSRRALGQLACLSHHHRHHQLLPFRPRHHPSGLYQTRLSYSCPLSRLAWFEEER
ncbi:hypothetical protein T439DRAFT_326455 [Meredithblackwellia eburnea MCA 4105]